MRTGIDAATLALYQSFNFQDHWRFRIANGSGSLVNMHGRVTSIDLAFPNPDSPIGGLSMGILREVRYDGTDSIAPTVTTSTLNRLNDGVTYAPLFELARLVTLDFALTAPGSARPADASTLWYEVFRGNVAKLSWPKLARPATATVRCNDRCGLLQDVKSETAFTYASGTPVETAIRQVLDNNGCAWMPTYTPVATGKVLSVAYAPGIQKTVWEQVWSIAQSIGWVCWLRYQADGTPALTLFSPPRNKTVADMALSSLFDVSAADVDKEQIRNVGYVQYSDASDARQKIGPIVDDVSIAQYGGIRRPFWISFGEDSPVRSEGDATAVLADALQDVSFPDFSYVLTVPPLPFVECANDLFALPGNPIFGPDTNVAPYAATLSVRANNASTSSLSVRERPSVGYRTWRRMDSTTTGDTGPWITDLGYDEAGETDTTYTKIWVPHSDYVWGAYETFEGNPTADKWAVVAAVAEAGQVISSPYIIEKPSSGHVGLLYLSPKIINDDGSVTSPPGAVAIKEPIWGPNAIVVAREVFVGDDTLQLVPVDGTTFQKVSFRTRVGGLDWSAWTDVVAAPYQATVGLDPKRVSDIAYRVYVESVVVQERVVSGFDMGAVANVLSITAADDGPNANIVADLDTDTATGTAHARYRVDGGANTSLDVPTPSRRITFSVPRLSAATQLVEVQGQNLAGAWGPWAPVMVNRLDASTAPTLWVGLQVVNRLDCDMGGTNRYDDWSVQWNAANTNDGVHAIMVQFFRDGVELTAEEQDGLAPSAGGVSGYTNTFNLAQTKSHYVRVTLYEISSGLVLSRLDSLTVTNSLDMTPCP